MLLLVILLLEVNPIIRIVTPLSKGKYELCEINVEEEKEVADYREDKYQEYHSTYPHSVQFDLKTAVGKYYSPQQYTDFNPKILVPPPQN